jgi:hypothetical protein
MNRLLLLQSHLDPHTTAAVKDSLSIIDNRTGIFINNSVGKSYELPIKDGAINATALGKITSAKGEVTRSFDPAYMNTVNCVRSFHSSQFRSLKYLSSTVTRESLNTEGIQLSNLLNHQVLWKSHTFFFSESFLTQNNFKSLRKSNSFYQLE